MVYMYKLNGHRGAFDCAARIAYPLSALALKIIETVTPPLTPECPSALRYAMAKYDSHDLADAYAEVYALYKKGLIFAEKAPEAAEAPAVYAIIDTSASAAKEKIENAAAAGFNHMIVLIKDGCTCLASSLREAYTGKADLKLIMAMDPASLSDADISALNGAECYIQIPGGDAFAADVLALADRGARFIDAAAIPSTEAGRKDAVRLAKEMDKRQKNGAGFAFAPFDLAMLSKEGFDSGKAACADCWAREICGGFRLSDAGACTAMCDNERTLVECAIVLGEEA